MKLGKDISAHFKDLYLVHQNLPGKSAEVSGHNAHLLFIPLQGTVTVKTATESHSFGPGQMLYLAPNLAHNFSSSHKSGERLIAMLAPRMLASQRAQARKLPLNQLTKEVLFYLLLHPHTKNAESLTKVFAETLAEILEETPSAKSLDHLEGRVKDPRVKQALIHLRKSVGRKTSLTEIAKRSGLSPRNFHRLLSEETGLQPSQWLISFRVERARELLKRPGASVTQVAFAVGYSSLGQFIGAFRSRTGRLPSEFQRG